MSRHLTLASLVAIGSVLQIFAAAPVVVVPDEATAVERFAAAEKEGEAFVSRVRRERLSVDHYMILNYDILKGIAAKKGYRWTRSATRTEAVEKWIADVKALGVKARRETTSAREIDDYFDSLRKENVR